ncbi:MAG: FHA domain-containing protein, partial [Bdellovibrionales bacterium]
MTFEKLRLDQPFHLQVMENGNLVFEHTFLEAPITIGRSVSCSVPLTKYNWISRQHFQVAMVDGRWVATDLNSANGMMYNGQAHSQLVLESGMVLEVGPLQFRFEFSTLHQKPEAQTLRSHESAYPTLNNAVKPHVPPAVHAPRAAFAPPRPVNFRNVRGLKLSPAWFEKSPEHSRILKRESGCAALSLNTISPQVARAPAQTRVFEVFLTWKDQVYDSRLYFAGDNISIGTDTDDLYAPNLKGSFLLGRFDGQHADIYLSKGAMGTVYRGNQRQNTLEQLLTGELIPRRGKGYSLSLSPSDRCEIELGSNLKLHARYATAPRQLSKTLAREPDHLMRKSLTYSGSVHLAFLLFALLMAPAQTIPKVKHLPPRVAKLLTPKETPVEIPKPKEAAPPPEPLKQAKEEPPKKRIEPKRPRPQPKKVVIRTNEKMKVINRLPKVAIQKTVDAAKPPPDI